MAIEGGAPRCEDFIGHPGPVHGALLKQWQPTLSVTTVVKCRERLVVILLLLYRQRLVVILLLLWNSTRGLSTAHGVCIHNQDNPHAMSCNSGNTD